jgi:hypothetical protein
MTHARTHSGHATAARRRNEQWIQCNTCGSHGRIRRFQAAPREAPSEVVEFWLLMATAVLFGPLLVAAGLAFFLLVAPGPVR